MTADEIVAKLLPLAAAGYAKTGFKPCRFVTWGERCCCLLAACHAGREGSQVSATHVYVDRPGYLALLDKAVERHGIPTDVLDEVVLGFDGPDAGESETRYAHFAGRPGYEAGRRIAAALFNPAVAPTTPAS